VFESQAHTGGFREHCSQPTACPKGADTHPPPPPRHPSSLTPQPFNIPPSRVCMCARAHRPHPTPRTPGWAASRVSAGSLFLRHTHSPRSLQVVGPPADDRQHVPQGRGPVLSHSCGGQTNLEPTRVLQGVPCRGGGEDFAGREAGCVCGCVGARERGCVSHTCTANSMLGGRQGA
jgi:hypothetical protein